MKIQKYYIIFVYILQWKENHATKVTKIPKTKRREYGMNETKMNRKKKEKRSRQKAIAVITRKLKKGIALIGELNA